MDENRPMTKRERKLAARAEKASMYREESKQNMVKWGIIGVASIVFLVFFGFMIFMVKGNSPASNAGPVEISEENGWVMYSGEGLESTASAAMENEAAVTLVEFGDFQCPACKAYHPVVKDVLAGYDAGQVKFVFKHFPLTSIHPNAIAAAVAADAAGAQGKFFEYHDLLFDNQEIWGGMTAVDASVKFEEYANNLGLNIDEFNSYREDSSSEPKVRASMDEGIGLGVNSTPSFFINGERIANPQAADGFRALIDATLNN